MRLVLLDFLISGIVEITDVFGHGGRNSRGNKCVVKVNIKDVLIGIAQAVSQVYGYG